MNRQIVLDTETTGLYPNQGHRIIEIAGVELVDRNFTGNNFHKYINPEREIDAQSFAIHGLDNAFLSDKPLFNEITNDFMDYIKGAELIIHNAVFDVNFINHEYKLVDKNFDDISNYVYVFDTLALARKKHPGKRNDLDSLCKRYGVDNKKRKFHGALLDADLLALVYLSMTGGQMNLFENETSKTTATNAVINKIKSDSKTPLIESSLQEKKEHENFLTFLKKSSKNHNSLWENSLS